MVDIASGTIISVIFIERQQIVLDRLDIARAE